MFFFILPEIDLMIFITYFRLVKRPQIKFALH